MKVSEFRNLIREEVRKVLKEANAPALSFDEITNIIQRHYFPSTDQRRRKEYEKILLNIGFLELKNGMYTVNRDASNSYRTTDNKTMRDILKWYDSTAISSHQKFGTANKKPSQLSKLSQSSKPSRSPKPGQKITDSDLVDDGYIADNHMDYWLDLLGDARMPDEWYTNPRLKAKGLKVANTWLKQNGYAWQVADALDQDEEGVVTWKIK